MPQKVTLTTNLARWTQQLVGIAQNGLTFSNSPFDVERYHELINLAAAMTAALNRNAQWDAALAAQLADLWRAQVAQRARGYVTPNVSVGALIFNEQDELLLIDNAVHNYWICPGGNIDPGYTAAQTVRKEVREETGLAVTPVALVAVNDSLAQGYHYPWHTDSLLFYCRIDGGTLQPQTKEVRQAAFFARDQLPSPILDGEPSWVEQAFAWHGGRQRQVYFDQ
jgi:ADP-ribose pyrophosphatase YjhB (NUDIX family)